MSTAKRAKRSSDSICPTEEKWSLRRLTDSGLKAVGCAPNTLQDTPLFVLRTCKHCGTRFGIKASMLKFPNRGQFCSRSCGTRAWVAETPKEWFQNQARKSLVPWLEANGSWNTGVPISESARQKLSEKAKLRGDPFKSRRGGNGTGMSRCEKILSRVLAPGWTWNYVVSTKPLVQSGWTGIPSNYKTDFAWQDRMTCLEVDGPSHRTRLGQERDSKKDAALKALGWTVLRISNEEVLSRYGTLK